MSKIEESLPEKKVRYTIQVRQPVGGRGFVFPFPRKNNQRVLTL